MKKEEVVKVNIYTTDVAENMNITKAYSEFFKETRPACTWLGVKALNRPSQMVEIEMQAIRSGINERMNVFQAETGCLMKSAPLSIFPVS